MLSRMVATRAGCLLSPGIRPLATAERKLLQVTQDLSQKLQHWTEQAQQRKERTFGPLQVDPLPWGAVTLHHPALALCDGPVTQASKPVSAQLPLESLGSPALSLCLVVLLKLFLSLQSRGEVAESRSSAQGPPDTPSSSAPFSPLGSQKRRQEKDRGSRSWELSCKAPAIL